MFKLLKQASSFSKKEMVLSAAIFAAIGGYGLAWGLASPSVVAKYEADKMSLPAGASVIKDKSASFNRAVKLSGNGEISQTAPLSQATNSLTVIARGDHCAGNWPKLKVTLDNGNSTSLTINKKGWRAYSVNAPAAAGSHSLKLSLTNTHSSSDCTRSLYLDRIIFYGKKSSSDQVPVTPPPPPVSTAPSVTLSANPTTVSSGESSVLTWSSTNVTSCAASGGWSGPQDVFGSESTPALTATQTYTLTCTGPAGSASKSVTVTVTSPPAPPPPPARPNPSPPPSSGGLVPGATLSYTTQQFLCNKALSSYGKLPIKVVVNPPVGHNYSHNGAVDLTTGCAGDGDPNTIDLIVDVRGDGQTYGPGIDAFKVRLQAGYNGGIVVTGTVNCGPRANSSVHQDGVQAQGGRDITFVDFNVGNYDAGISTCQGAGGAMFYSSAGGTQPQNMNVIRGKYIACNHSLLAGTGTGQVSNAFFRSGRTDGSDPKCVGFAASNPCIDESAVTLVNNTCQRWSGGKWQ